MAIKLSKLFSIGSLILFISLASKSQGQEITESIYSWSAPGGQYINPTSFFSMHGYVNAVFASSSEEWTQTSFNGIGMPGQVIVPNVNNSSFQNDEAIWLNSEIDPKTSLVMELHLVTSPSGTGAAGPGGLTFVLTEALASWKVYKNYLNFSFGTFWSPFGIQNKDWLGAQNSFSLMPVASGAYITHFNEKGVRVDGVLLERDKWGVNYVLGYGNGYNAWDISGYTSWDLNENKSFNGRVSVFPGFGKNVEVGISFGQGNLNNPNTGLTVADIAYFGQEMIATGVDLQVALKKFSYRGYLINSQVKMSADQLVYNKESVGVLNEISYTFPLTKIVESVTPKFRFDYLQQVSDFPEMADNYYSRISAGVNFKMNRSFTVSLDHNWLIENNPLDNNRILCRVSAEF